MMIEAILIALGLAQSAPPPAVLLYGMGDGLKVERYSSLQQCHAAEDILHRDYEARMDRWNDPAIPVGSVLLFRAPEPVKPVTHCIEK